MKRVYRSTIPLELVAGPQCPVSEVVAWLTLLNEFPRIKNPVVGLKPEVTIRLPLHFHPWTMPKDPRGMNTQSRDSQSQLIGRAHDRNNTAEHTAEIVVASHRAAEIE